MSRCFPFPPPGYEKKDRLDDTNLLKKEKPTEKRHKKDKKDKEKREHKGKKDTQKSEEKCKGKKHKKQKHKDKDRDKDKEKKKNTDEKKTVEQPVCYNGKKLDQNHLQSVEAQDSKFLLELGKRLRNEGGAGGAGISQKIAVTDERIELSGKMVENNSISNSAEGKEKIKEKRGDAREANGQEKKVETSDKGNSVVQDLAGMDQKKVGGGAKPVDKSQKDAKKQEEKIKNKHMDNNSRGDRHKDNDREKKSKSKHKDRDKQMKKDMKVNEMGSKREHPKLPESGKDSVDSHNIKSSYLLNENKNNFSGDRNLGKRKELETNGVLHEKDVRPSKLMKPVSSSHQVVESGRELKPCPTAFEFASEKQEAVDNHKVDNKVTSSNAVLENGKKLELCQHAMHSALGMQGAANNHKLDNGVSSSHPVTENGRKFEPHQCAMHSASVMQRVADNHKVDNRVSSLHPVVENGRKLETYQQAVCSASGTQETAINHQKESKETRINGSTEAQQPNICLRQPPSAPVQAKHKVKASVKPPHPDSKYLGQILSVPKKECLLDFDEQEWLFNSDSHLVEKHELGFSKVDGRLQVWAESLRVDPADVTALPYVIPY